MHPESGRRYRLDQESGPTSDVDHVVDVRISRSIDIRCRECLKSISESLFPDVVLTRCPRLL